MAFLYNGHSTQLLILNPIVGNAPILFRIRVKTLTPPELDGTGGLDSSDMGNLRLRTMAPKSLLSTGQLKASAYYDPAIYSDMFNPTLFGLLLNTQMVIKFPDQTGLLIWAWVDKIAPPEHKEGDEPIMDMTVIPSNRNNLNSVFGTAGAFQADGAEVLPRYLNNAAMRAAGYIDTAGRVPQL